MISQLIEILALIFIGPLVPKYYRKSKIKCYIIKENNRFDMQRKNECAAFSVAYLLRHLKQEASGNFLDQKISHKLVNGYVLPKGIIKLLKEYRITVTLCTGNINSLKLELLKGKPVIVLIKTLKYMNYLHYVPVVGFDDEYIYIVESLSWLINCQCESYNRAIPVKEFEMLWRNTLPFIIGYKNIFFSMRSSKWDRNE